MEADAVERKKKNAFDLDLNRIKISDSVFDKIQKKNEKSFAIYGGDGRHRCTQKSVMLDTVMATIKQRKLELECLKSEK